MPPAETTPRPHPLVPLREPLFRRIWATSVLGNLGQLAMGVGAAWEMTRLTSSPTMVALVQSAMMLPIMFASLPAGALADMFDRRKVAIAGLSISVVSASLLTVLALFDLTTPWLLLAACFAIGVGVAVYNPAWAATIPEQVSAANLPAAVALGTISNSLARSFGPALGGLLVVALGAQAVFGLNALFYLPMLLAFVLWRRQASVPRLPPEGLVRAMQSGVRYVVHSPVLMRTLLRIFLFGLTCSTGSALAPLIARDLLGGDAAIFGVLLGAGGVGAVIGAFYVSHLREWLGTENASRLLMVVAGVALVVSGLSRNLALTCLAMCVTGAANILVIALYNVTVQLSAPRWVLARALSLYSSALTGGIAIGSWLWGVVSQLWAVDMAMIASGVAMAFLAAASVLLPLREDSQLGTDQVKLTNEPEIGLDITLRSGPVVIEIETRVAEAEARAFYNATIRLRPLRLRNGAFDWSLSRDIADPELWTERYQCPTWADYLRIRDRQTSHDRAVQAEADRFLKPGTTKAVRRRLGRPFGSVRWQTDTPERAVVDPGYITP